MERQGIRKVTSLKQAPRRPVFSFHIPLRKDVPEEDFKVALSKGKSHLESFSQNEKQII